MFCGFFGPKCFFSLNQICADEISSYEKNNKDDISSEY
jgi:hypothetical protein